MPLVLVADVFLLLERMHYRRIKMASRLINRVNSALRSFDNIIASILSRRFPPEALCVLESSTGQNWPSPIPKAAPFSLKNLLGDGFLWAVPKHRRTVEKRMKRKFGHPDYHWKLLRPKTNLLVCNTCGHDYEAGILCGHCYNKVKAETKEMQDAIHANMGLSPIEKDVVVLYDGEKTEEMAEYWKNKRIVEMPKKRPTWFQKNLLQQTTQEPSDSKEIEPTQLA